MRRIICLVLLLALAGCESRFNPFNWFSGRDEPLPPAEATPDPITLDRRQMIARVDTLQIEESRGGLILIAYGTAPTPGYWASALLLENRGLPRDGVLTYQFRVARPPEGSVPPGAQPVRITAATLVENRQLAGVSQIVVRSQSQAISVRP